MLFCAKTQQVNMTQKKIIIMLEVVKVQPDWNGTGCSVHGMVWQKLGFIFGHTSTTLCHYQLPWLGC